MHFSTDNPLNEIKISGETILNIDVNSGWTITDVWFDHDVPTELIDCIKVKFEKRYDDRKTENCSEIPNNSTISKMEQVDKDINVRSKDEPQTDNGIGCSRCEGRFDCYDRDMPHAVHCNNYGKITDEPQTEKKQTMNDRKRCCCNCRRCIRTWDGGHCTTHCEIDGHYIGYVECFEGWCRRWAKDKWQEERREDNV